VPSTAGSIQRFGSHTDPSPPPNPPQEALLLGLPQTAGLAGPPRSSREQDWSARAAVQLALRRVSATVASGDAGSTRLLSRGHSILAESFAGFLGSKPGWVVEPEVSFAIYGERGVVDQLAWHAGEAHLLVVELKTAFVDVNEMLGTLDRKRRLAGTIAATRGWRPRLVSVWLIVVDTHTNRRHADDHRALLGARFPLDGRQLRPFLARPCAAASGLAFWPTANPRSTGLSRRRGEVRIEADRTTSSIRSSTDSSRGGRNASL